MIIERAFVYEIFRAMQAIILCKAGLVQVHFLVEQLVGFRLQICVDLE